MPGIVKVRVIRARDLPVMDRNSDSTDGYCTVSFGAVTHKTAIKRKTLNPVWNADFRFEVNDEDMQDEQLELKLWDYDTISADDAIGKVSIDLNPLLMWGGVTQLSGFFPIFDTIRGIRGELMVQVKLDVFSDANRFRDTSCGIQFYAMSSLPPCYRAISVLGFVEELTVNDDPEHQWVDNFRKSRTSNETRQQLFFRMSGELRRRIGVKVVQLGGNAVIGYQQAFDLEGENNGIVARGIGVAMLLGALGNGDRDGSPLVVSSSTIDLSLNHRLGASGGADDVGDGETVSVDAEDSNVDVTSMNSVNLSCHSTEEAQPQQSSAHRKHVKIMRHQPGETTLPLLTLTLLPPGMLKRIGGVVAVRSVKLLHEMKNPDEPESRDKWWLEVRDEIRSHARVLGCSAVIGYREDASIHDELVVYSAIGTAVVLNMNALQHQQAQQNLYHRAGGNGIDGSSRNISQSTDGVNNNISTNTTPSSVLDHSPLTHELSSNIGGDTSTTETPGTPKAIEGGTDDTRNTLLRSSASRRRHRRHVRERSGLPGEVCSMCHIPYTTDASNSMRTVVCGVCRKHLVPEVIFATIAPPPGLPLAGPSQLLEARVSRQKKKAEDGKNATTVSDKIPFLEYDLHRQLMLKLRLTGMNAIFCLQMQVTVGEELIIAVASATAVHVRALPMPPPLSIARSLGVIDAEDVNLVKIQLKLMDISVANHAKVAAAVEACNEAAVMRERATTATTMRRRSSSVRLTQQSTVSTGSVGELTSSSSCSSDSDTPAGPDMCNGSNRKTAFVVSVDDETDEDLMAILLDPPVPEGYYLVNSECFAGQSGFEISRAVQFVTIVKKMSLMSSSRHLNQQFSSIFHALQQGLMYKMRWFTPCVICNIKYDVQVPENEEVQLLVTAMIVSLKPERPLNSLNSQEEIAPLHSGNASPPLATTTTSPSVLTAPGRPFVQLCSMCGLPGQRIVRYLGHVNLYFIKETASLREAGGMAVFTHNFISECHALARANAGSTGSNAIVGLKLSLLVAVENSTRNQGYILVNVTGDMVFAVDSNVHPDGGSMDAVSHVANITLNQAATPFGGSFQMPSGGTSTLGGGGAGHRFSRPGANIVSATTPLKQSLDRLRHNSLSKIGGISSTTTIKERDITIEPVSIENIPSALKSLTTDDSYSDKSSSSHSSQTGQHHESEI